MDQETALSELIDRDAIRQQIYRYCRSVDRLDIPLGHSVFHENATADYGATYNGSGRGAIDHICAAHLGLLYHSHQVTNILIELDGDRAGSEAYVTAALQGRRDGRLFQMTVRARYCDRWSRRDGRWAIDARVTVTDFDEMRDITPARDNVRGRRDGGDASYAALDLSQ